MATSAEQTERTERVASERSVANAVKQAETIAQQLQKRRDGYIKVLEALPMPKARVPDLPYSSMEAAVKDEFKLFEDGPEGAWAYLVKGFKTAAWRKQAERNRAQRDDAAEGEVPRTLAVRVAKLVKTTTTTSER
jgi:hypothetical protein